MKISFHLHVNENLFSHERSSTRTRFEKESKSNSEMAYSLFSCDVTAAMLVYRAIAKKVFLGFYYYAKRMRNFAIVLYTNIAASLRELRRDTGT